MTLILKVDTRGITIPTTFNELIHKLKLTKNRKKKYPHGINFILVVGERGERETVFNDKLFTTKRIKFAFSLWPSCVGILLYSASMQDDDDDDDDDKSVWFCTTRKAKEIYIFFKSKGLFSVNR